MKKLIAISVMIALIAGAAFADTSLGGGVSVRFTAYSAKMGDFTVDGFDPYDGGFPKATTGSTIASGYLVLSGTNDEGTLGGLWSTKGTINYGNNWDIRSFIWWQPIDQVRIFLGKDGDGKFGTDVLEAWPFHQGEEGFQHVHNWGFWRDVFIGNWDGLGMAFSFYLVPGLGLNLVVPTEGGSNFDSIWIGGLQLSVDYAIADVGKVMFTWIGDKTNYFDEDNADFGKIGLSFNMDKVVDGLQVHAGFSTHLSKSADDGGADDPIYVGLGIHYGAGDFGLKFRGAVVLPTGDAENLYLTTNIMPFYNLGSFTAFLDFGIAMDKATKDGDAALGFWVNPYVRVPIAGGSFRAGISVRSNVDFNQNVLVKDPDANKFTDISIPMTFAFSF